jgi:hypothetical protein
MNEKLKRSSNSSPGSAYMEGRRPNEKDPSCPSGGYVYGQSTHAGKSPSPKRQKG